MKLKLAILLVFSAALCRLIPHPVNFTPLGAIGLFAAAYFNRNWLMLAVPFAALFLSDMLLNNLVYRHLYPESTGLVWVTSLWIYAAFALVMLIGFVMLRGRVSIRRVLLASLIASGAFFLVSNFSVWANSPMYPQTGAGLLTCFAAGLPYLPNTIFGDLFFSAVLMGGFEWVSRKKLAGADA